MIRFVLELVESGSYYAIRVRADARATQWWSVAELAENPPLAMRGLLDGRDRVEVSANEATEILAWAAPLNGGARP
jgi:hypothetical protein